VSQRSERTGLEGEAILVGGTSLNIFDQDVKKVDFSCQFCGAGNESSTWKEKISKNGEKYITVKCHRCYKKNRYIGSKLYIEGSILYTYPTPRTKTGDKIFREFSNRTWWTQYTYNRELDRDKYPVSQDEIIAFCKIIRGSGSFLVDGRKYLYNMALSNINKVIKVIESELLKEEDRYNIESLYTQLVLIDQIIQLADDRDLTDGEKDLIVTPLIFKIMIFSNHNNPKITRIIAKIIGKYFKSNFDSIDKELSIVIQNALLEYLSSKDWITKTIAIYYLDIQKTDKSLLSQYIKLIPELLIDKDNRVRWEISRQITQNLEYLRLLNEFSLKNIKSHIEENSHSDDIFLASISEHTLEKINAM